jgi:hypothetical protein
MNSKNKAELRIELQAAMIRTEAWQSCLNCLWWQGDKECGKFNAVPPAHVIVNGCRDHEADIPF